MTITADTNAVEGRYAFESVEGVAPNVAAKTFRITSVTVNPEFTTTNSQEIISSLRTRRKVRTGEGGMLTLGFEASYETLDDFLALMLLSQWVPDEPATGTDRLRDGVLRPSMSFEVHYTDLANVILRLEGAKAQALTLTLQRDQIVSGTIDLMGLEVVPATVTAFASVSPRTTTEVYNAVDHIVAINEGGSPINRVEQVQLSFTRSLRRKGELGEIRGFSIGVGKLQTTGSLRAHFASLALFEKMKNFTDSSFDFALQDVAGNRLACFYPLMQFSDGSPADVPGEDQDVVGVYNFEGVEPDDQSRQIEFQRTEATTP